jgi:tRNA 2-thiocytidine biosynthesis protein TtcA
MYTTMTMSTAIRRAKLFFVTLLIVSMIKIASPWVLICQKSSTLRETHNKSTTALFSLPSAAHDGDGETHVICRPEDPLEKAVVTINPSKNTSATLPATAPVGADEKERLYRLQGKLLKNLRRVSKDYNMLENGDHIMVAVSGGKDSATLLYLLKILQSQLPIQFDITAVHVDQKQPGYDGTALVDWLEKDLQVPYQVVEEDTYSVVLEKTEPNKSFCTLCSRLRRGILSSKAIELGCNKIALGHHADDAAETLFLNMIHSGQMKGMPARYTSKRGSLGVLRPLIHCFEDDIARFATMKEFPILPCNLCSNQANLQRPQIKLLLQTLQGLNPMANKNILIAMGDVRPSHLLDQDLRRACGMDPITGQEEDEEGESMESAIHV